MHTPGAFYTNLFSRTRKKSNVPGFYFPSYFPRSPATPSCFLDSLSQRLSSKKASHAAREYHDSFGGQANVHLASSLIIAKNAVSDSHTGKIRPRPVMQASHHSAPLHPSQAGSLHGGMPLPLPCPVQSTGQAQQRDTPIHTYMQSHSEAIARRRPVNTPDHRS